MATYDKRFKMYVESIRKRRTRYSLSITEKVRDVFKNNTGDGLRVSALVRLFKDPAFGRVFLLAESRHHDAIKKPVQITGLEEWIGLIPIA